MSPHRITAVVKAISLERHSPQGFREIEDCIFSKALAQDGSTTAEISAPVLVCKVDAEEEDDLAEDTEAAANGWNADELEWAPNCCCCCAAALCMHDAAARSSAARGPHPKHGASHGASRRSMVVGGRWRTRMDRDAYGGTRCAAARPDAAAVELVGLAGEEQEVAVSLSV